jgi:hypothetical protein
MNGGFRMQYPPLGSYAPVPQAYGGYQARYPPPATFAPVQQGHGGFYPAQAYLHPGENSGEPAQGATPAYEPGANDSHLRMGANDFVQGANGHDV